MKVRIVKTDFGYTPQVYTDYYGDVGWHSIGNIGSHVSIWDNVSNMYDHCIYRTQWGAKRILNKWIEENVTQDVKFQKLMKQLENPNVVYEAEV